MEVEFRAFRFCLWLFWNNVLIEPPPPPPNQPTNTPRPSIISSTVTVSACGVHFFTCTTSLPVLVRDQQAAFTWLSTHGPR